MICKFSTFLMIPAELLYRQCSSSKRGFKSSTWSSRKNLKRELWRYLWIKIATFWVRICVFSSKSRRVEFWKILEFTFLLLESICMFTFLVYVVILQSFFAWWCHTFLLIFSMMREISLKNGLKFAYQRLCKKSQNGYRKISNTHFHFECVARDSCE